jgi:hypothetical protein
MATLVLGELAITTRLPDWSVLIPVGFQWAVTIFPDALITATGGPLPVAGLARDLRDLQLRMERLSGGPSPSDPAELDIQKRLARLDRWRDPTTTEYIDLYKETLNHFLDGQPMAAKSDRLARMADLRQQFDVILKRFGIAEPFP